MIGTLDPVAATKFRPFIEAAKEAARKENCDYVAISGNRTWAEQDALYAIGRTKPGKKVTNARGGFSNHNFGIALDFGVFRDGKYLDEKSPHLAAHVHRLAGKLAGKFGLEWGGAWTTFVDFPHFQVKTGMTLAQMRARVARTGSVFG